MIVTTTENVAGHDTVESLGQVFGVVVRSRGLGGNIVAGLRSLIGGEIKEYTSLVEDTRRHAVDRLVANARLMGGPARRAMSGGAKTVGYAVGALLIGGGLLLEALHGGGLGLLLFGALVIAGIALEPRYRRSATGSAPAAWQPTGERFIDDETGELIEVWYDPASGRRDYRPVRP